MAIISVIVPVFSAEPFIRRCIDSILSQSFTDFELILVDDGGSDNCGRICDNYAAKDKRVYVFHQNNQGQAAARNHALDWVFAASDSQYIGFADSDDWVHPRFLELLLEGIKRYPVSICQCKFVETDGKAELPEVAELFSCLTPEEQYTRHYSASMWDKLFARSCWSETRFPEGQIYEDVAIWYKLLFRENSLAYTDAVLYYYYVNPDSTVHKAWTPAKLAQIRAWEEQLCFLAKNQSEEVLRCGVQRGCLVAGLQFSDVENMLHLSEKKRYLRIIRRYMRGFLQHYGKHVRNCKDYMWYFTIGYPFRSWLYWTLKSVFHQ